MAEQSMETAAKGFARRVGMSYDDVKVEGHNLLHLYAKTLDRVVKGTETASRLDKLLSRLSVQGEAYNTLDQLQHMLALTASPRDEKHRETVAREFFGEMMTASPEVVKTLLTVLEKTYGIVDTAISNSTLIENLVTKPLVLRVPRSGRKVARYMASQVLKQVNNRQRMKRNVRLLLQDVLPRMMADAIGETGEERFLAELKEREGKFSFTKEQLLRPVDGPKASIGLLIVGSIVWPHESYPRYPASPEAARLNFGDAARQGKRRLGSQHYSDSVGAIKYIRELSAHAERVTTLLYENYTDGFFFPDWADA